jgi:hypothetical protein
VSSGCIRLTNADVIDLFGRVKVGSKVVVLSQTARQARPATMRATRTSAVSATSTYLSTAPVIVPVATASTRSESGFAFGLH